MLEFSPMFIVTDSLIIIIYNNNNGNNKQQYSGPEKTFSGSKKSVRRGRW